MLPLAAAYKPSVLLRNSPFRWDGADPYGDGQGAPSRSSPSDVLLTLQPAAAGSAAVSSSSPAKATAARGSGSGAQAQQAAARARPVVLAPLHGQPLPGAAAATAPRTSSSQRQRGEAALAPASAAFAALLRLLQAPFRACTPSQAAAEGAHDAFGVSLSTTYRVSVSRKTLYSR